MKGFIAKPIAAAVGVALFSCVAQRVVHAADATPTVVPTAIPQPNAVTIQAALVIMRQPDAHLWRGIALLARTRHAMELLDQAALPVDIVTAAQAVRDSAVVMKDNADLQKKLEALVGTPADSDASGELGQFQKEMLDDHTKHPKWPAGLQLSASDKAEFDRQLKGHVKDVRDKINAILAGDKLKAAQQKFYQRADEVAGKVQTNLATIKADEWSTQFPASDAGPARIKKLTPALAALQKALPQLAKIQSAYNALLTAQSVAKGVNWSNAGTEQAAFETKMKALGEGDLAVRSAVEKVPEALKYITDCLPAAVTMVVQLVQEIGPQPPANAAVRFETASKQLKDLHTLAASVGQLHAALKARGNTYDATIEKNNEQLEKQRVSRQIMADAIATIDEGLAGDMSKFEVRQARLFYFTNAVQLLKALNPKARLLDAEALDAREASQRNHRLVIANDQELNEALGEVNDLRVASERLRTSVEQARQDRRRAQSTLTRESRQLSSLKAKMTALEGKTDDDAVTKRTQLQSEETRQNETVEDATAADDAAQNHLKELQGDFDSTQARQREALNALSSAQKKVREVRSAQRLVALDDLEAFRQRIDNPVVWFAPSNPLSTDPARRVQIYAFENSATLFLRGEFSDVNRVREIIAEYDRPVPQALITLWTVQLNGSNAGKMNSATNEIEGLTNDLGRHLIEIQIELQGLIVEEVNRVAKLYSDKNPGLDPRLARTLFYAPEVREQLGLQIDEECLIKRNGSNSAPADNCPTLSDAFLNDERAVTRFTLPDPANVTTLGQSFFVLSLARRSSREIITQRFRLVLLNSLKGLASESPAVRAALTSEDGRNVREPYFPFVLFGSKAALDPSLTQYQPDKTRGKAVKKAVDDALNKALVKMKVGGSRLNSQAKSANARYEEIIFKNEGHTLETLKNDRELTGNQKEILLAIEVKARENVTHEIQWLLSEIRTTQAEELKTRLRERYLPLLGWLAFSVDMLPSATSFSQSPTWTALGLQASLGSLRYSPIKNRPSEEALSILQPDELTRMDAMALEITRSAESSNLLSRAVPRVAAADKMIKEMIRLAQSNLDTYLVQPSLIEMQKRVQGKGVKLGSLQRTSILSTNRALSRVDPSATASLQFDSEVDYLKSATQLAAMASQVKDYKQRSKSSAATTGALGTAGALLTKGTSTGNALGIGALLSILGANTEVPPAPGDVYSINTGNEWVVTPIFDPSGQAMRFKFDYNASVRVREPDGTVNPLLPRIERHAVNTEVGLNNLEFGEVSRFDTNSKIGLPDRRTGGVPLLRELPLLRDIPLVGYFARQRRQAAESQRSLIFAQTTMYPTVSDIVALMVAPGRSASTLGSLQRSEINPDDLFSQRN